VLAHGRSAHFNVQRARKALDWSPETDVAAGLRAVAAWAARVGPDAVAKATASEAPPAES
jgi:hypothetical protein